MPGSTLGEWGPAAWNTLHVFAHTAPPELDEFERERFRQFLTTFAVYIPCPKCSRHFQQFLRRRMTDDALATRASIVSMLNDAHNEVNARTGKRVYSLEEHYDVYSLSSTRGAKRRGTMIRDVAVLTVVALIVVRLAQRREVRV